MRSVCVAPYLPYPGVDHAGGEYLLRYLSHLVEQLGWQVTLVIPGTEANRARIGECPFDVHLHPFREQPSPVRAAGRLIHHGANTPRSRTWLRSLPGTLEETFASADLLDLQWSESILLAPELRRRYPGVTIVGTAHDVLAQSVARGRRSPARRERIRSLLAASVRTTEPAGLAACDKVLVFNPEDEDRLRRMGVTRPIGVAPAFIALNDVPAPSSGSRRVLFVGAMWRPENSEAALWLIDEVLPLVREKVPDVVVRIAGARPPDALRRRASDRVEVTGFLTDLAQAYDDVALVVAPLQRGAGLKFKVLQAMAAGFPVITTTVGAEGVAAASGHLPSVVADDAPSFAQAIVAMLQDHRSRLTETLSIAAGVRDSLAFDKRVTELAADLQRIVDRGCGSAG